MYAVLVTGGKQFKVKAGDFIYAEKIEAEDGSEIVFDTVLAVGGDDGVKFGTPTLEGVTVQGKVIKTGKSKKIIVYKMKAKKGYRKKQGHRQAYTKIEIIAINA